MNYSKQALTELLSGLTTKKNEKEIWIKHKNWESVTVELVDDECYILRMYYENGQLRWEEQYKNNQRHGFYRWWHENGKIGREDYWENGKFVKITK